MRASDQLRIAGRLAAATPGRTGALAMGLAVALFLPALTSMMVGRLDQRLADRLDGAPLLLAQAGDPYGLCLSTLAFVGPAPAPLPWGARRPLLGRADIQVLPLRVGRSVQGLPLVGVGADWLSAWSLALAEGRDAALPGELVVGASAARRLGLALGDQVQADPQDLYDLGGPVPLPLTVVGLLADSKLPEDGALLTPVQTTWALDGALHGHASGTDGGDGAGDAQDPWQDLHLHGNVDEQPISALLVRAGTARAQDLLLAELDANPKQMTVMPGRLWQDLISASTLPRRLLLAWAACASIALMVLGAVVLQLSQRSRAPTLGLLRALGAGPGLVRSLFALELALIAALGLCLAGLGLGVVALLWAVAEAAP